MAAQNSGATSPSGGGHNPPKWAVLIDDELVWSPGQKVESSVLRAQANVDGKVLVRDHNSPNDVVIGEHDAVDLALGNVFYTLSKEEVQPRAECTDPAKLAFFVDDRHEVTTRANQTGATVRGLFGLDKSVVLFRDFDSRNDVEVKAEDPATYSDGPVFYTREVQHELAIIVNSRTFTDKDGVKHEMTGEQIAALVYPQNAKETTVREIEPEPRDVPLDKPVHIRNGEKFEVVRNNVTGGNSDERISRELAELTKSGQQVTRVHKPAAVIYHSLRTKPGAPVAATDVLVLVPSAYPGQMIDGAYLPENSPLIGKVKGEPQDPRVDANGVRWRLISYHPHNGGGGPAWNPQIHGFHTYISELLSWLNNLR